MLTEQDLPKDLLAKIGNEKKDFIVKSKREASVGFAMGIIAFAVFGLIMTLQFFFSDNMPTIFWLIVLCFFIFVEILFLILGISLLFAKGSYFIGTPKHLIQYKKEHYIDIYEWKDFNGCMKVSGNNKKGNITLELNTGEKINNNSNQYAPDIVHAEHITDTLDIEKICLKRLREANKTTKHHAN